jgi:hypothetical protein
MDSADSAGDSAGESAGDEEEEEEDEEGPRLLAEVAQMKNFVEEWKTSETPIGILFRAISQGRPYTISIEDAENILKEEVDRLWTDWSSVFESGDSFFTVREEVIKYLGKLRDRAHLIGTIPGDVEEDDVEEDDVEEDDVEEDDVEEDDVEEDDVEEDGKDGI